MVHIAKFAKIKIQILLCKNEKYVLKRSTLGHTYKNSCLCVCSLVVLFSMCEQVLAVHLCAGDVHRCVHPSDVRERSLQAGAVLLQTAPQLIVQAQQLGILSFKGLLQEGRGYRE